jgi:hypothetical protein
MVVLLIVVQSLLFEPGDVVTYRTELPAAKCEETRAGMMALMPVHGYTVDFHCLPK